MVVIAVVPVKGLSLSKKRLSAILSLQERRLLTAAMFEDVVTALKSSTVDKIAAISSDPIIRATANKFAVPCLSENRTGLNPIIEEATKWCTEMKSDSMLVLPADIPLVSPKDINKITEMGIDNASVVISPSKNGGTNALLRKPPNIIEARFGSNSFIRHLKEATRKYVSISIYCSKGIVCDIDFAEDLKYLENENATATSQVLNQIKYFSKKIYEQTTSFGRGDQMLRQSSNDSINEYAVSMRRWSKPCREIL